MSAYSPTGIRINATLRDGRRIGFTVPRGVDPAVCAEEVIRCQLSIARGNWREIISADGPPSFGLDWFVWAFRVVGSYVQSGLAKLDALRRRGELAAIEAQMREDLAPYVAQAQAYLAAQSKDTTHD